MIPESPAIPKESAHRSPDSDSDNGDDPRHERCLCGVSDGRLLRLSGGAGSVRSMSTSLAHRTYSTGLRALVVSELPDTVRGRDQVDAAVARQVDEYVAAEPSRCPRRVRRQRTCMTRLHTVLAQARALDDSTAMLVVAALSGDTDAVDSARLIAAEPVAPAPDDALLRQYVWLELERHLLDSGMSLQQLDRLAAAGRFTATVEQSLPDERRKWERYEHWGRARAMDLKAVCMMLLTLLDKLAAALNESNPALARVLRGIARLVRVIERAVREQLRLLALRTANLPPPWAEPPRLRLTGALQQCAPPFPAADVTPTGHVAAVAA